MLLLLAWPKSNPKAHRVLALCRASARLAFAEAATRRQVRRVAGALAEAQASTQLPTLYPLPSSLYLLKLQLQTYSSWSYLQAIQQYIQLAIAALVYQVSAYVKHKQESPLKQNTFAKTLQSFWFVRCVFAPLYQVGAA